MVYIWAWQAVALPPERLTSFQDDAGLGDAEAGAAVLGGMRTASQPRLVSSLTNSSG